MTTVRDIGEFALIDRLGKQVSEARLLPPLVAGFRLRLGIGDDAAAWRPGGGMEVCTTDTAVDGVHFTRETMSWRDVGWKVMAANLSDVAAMGAAPSCAVVTLGLPGDLDIAAVDDLYAGMIDVCRRFRALIVGGDVVSSPTAFISVTLTGACAAEPLTRSAARPGDVIAVTGALGASAGGLRLLQAGAGASAELVRAHRLPMPRIAEGRELLRAGVRCAMDISDGLLLDLAKLCTASGTGARVDAGRVPVAPGLEEAFGAEALNLALGGGEDYELIFAGPARVIGPVLSELPRARIIGEVTAGEPGDVTVVTPEGDPLSVASEGWEHLR